ncbi:MAG: autotransporter outer membrane beta-barrel domain-containing protein, partial [Planctomycetaceae bacterium]|nr:autotransporter outer membrane beta-barrel domain-containing protein [Planctomycetaceae bacterium]
YRANTGIDATSDVRGTVIQGGLAAQKRAFNGSGRILLGAFVDAGDANYGTYNFVSSFEDSFRGRGDIDYLGAGAFFRREWDNGFRFDAMLRGGNVTNKFRSYDMAALYAENLPLSYRTSNSYWGMNVGLNYTEKLSNRSKFDIYGRYSWVTIDGGRVELSSTEVVDFKALESVRLIFGGRWTVRQKSSLSWYLGAAYEQELEGISQAIERETGRNNTVGNSSIKGGTAVGEVGVTMRPNERWQLTTGLEGYSGKRAGGGVHAAAAFKW